MLPVQNHDQEIIPGNRKNDVWNKLLSKFTLVTKLCLVLAVLSCMVYANTVKNGYVLDDFMMITGNSYVKKGIGGIPLILKTTHMKGFVSNLASDDYRPLSLIMFALEYELFGPNPAVGHIFNILVFAGCVVMLFLFLNKLFNGEKVIVAFIASLLFALHPIHTEVVANIKSRDELLCFFLAFLSLNIFIDYAKQGKIYQLIAAAFCLFLSFLSKESSVTFLGIIPLVFFFYLNENKKRTIHIVVSAATAFILFLCIWYKVQGSNGHPETLGAKITHSLSAGGSLTGANLAADILILGYHLKLLFVPYPLSFIYSFKNFAFAGFGNLWVIISFIAYLFLGITGFRRLFKNRKDPWAFGILYYLITIFIYSNILFILAQSITNRYAFFPSAGFCLVMALVFEKWILKTNGNNIRVLKNVKSLVILVPVILCYSMLTIARNADWKDNFTLVNADLHKSPDDYTMQYKAGLELQNKYDAETDSSQKREVCEESIKYFSRSLEINTEYTEAHADMGVAYFRLKNYDSAELHFKRTLELNPCHFNATSNLATLYFEKKQFNDAIFYYRKVIKIDSTIDIVWYNLGICFARIKQYDSSVWSMKKVIEIAPQLDNYKSYGNVAIMYKMMDQMDSARKYEQITKQYYPDFNL